MCQVRELTMEELRKALHANIAWQQQWSRKLERILYFQEEAPPLFVSYGKHIIGEHQDKIDLIEKEMERRARVDIFKRVYQEIVDYEARMQ